MPEPSRDEVAPPVEGNNAGIDFTRYPEGFEAVLTHLDFLPNDHAVRTRFLISLMETLARR